VNKLYYLGNPEDGFGWGVANTNLIRSLGEFCEVEIAPRTRRTFNAPIFVPIATQDLKPDVKYDAPLVMGYCFLEWPIPDKARVHARAYDLLFAGSTWNVQRLAEKGIKAQPLLQGIDHERFSIKPWNESKPFVVFSGGKFEYRKGQDLVIAAMRLFMKMHPDSVLIAAWHNKWPQSIATMQHSNMINLEDPFAGLPEGRVVHVPPMPNEKTPEVYAQAHIGLFPNRCEAGTNLVMCEFMACGRPVIATYAHGHKDVLDRNEYILPNGSYDPAGWFHCNISDIIAKLEHAYKHREELKDRGQASASLVSNLTWRACAEKICEAAFPAPVPV